MAENTTKQESGDNVSKASKKGSSVLAKIGNWLIGKKDVPPGLAGSTHESGRDIGKKSYKGKRPQKSAGARKRPPARPRSGKPRKPVSAVAQKQAPGRKTGPSPVVKKEGAETGKGKNVIRKLLINTDEPEECRIAMIEDGRLEAFYLETVLHAQTKGNIYKAKVVSVEPSLQAAFVDMGEGKNGFLPFGDIHPEYFHDGGDLDTHWKDLDSNKFIRKGDEVLVQVVKEAVANKGANLTTFLSLPGRYLVLMPGSDSAGISRKIESESQRKKLRNLIESLTLPEGIGYIVRTASKDITKGAISEDLKYLLNLWGEIKGRGGKMLTRCGPASGDWKPRKKRPRLP
jgi:ribonuclease E